MVNPARRGAQLTGALLIAALAGCGGDGDGASPTSSTAASSSVTTAATTAPSTVTSPGSTLAPGSDESRIERVFVEFFDGLSPDVASRAARLEHGDVLSPMLADAAADPQFSQMSTQVRSVRLVDAGGCAGAGVIAPCAEVVHDLLVGQFPAVPAKTSYAVQVGGEWKVAAKTWCEIVTIGGATCPPL